MKPIVIIGGGFGGLSLGYFLSKKGLPVHIIERDKTLGGTCRPIPLGDDFVDSYYHVLSGGKNSLRDLISEIGLDSEVFPVKITQGFYKNGVIHPASGIVDLLSFSVLTWLDRILLAKIFLHAKCNHDWQKLDRMTAQEWLTTIGGEKLYDQFWKPVMSCKFGDAVSSISAADMWFRIKRLGDVTLPGTVSACYIQGTLKRVLDRLEDIITKKNGIIEKNITVQEIREKKGRVVSILLSNGSLIETDIVVSTIPLPELVNIIPPSYETYKKELENIGYLHNVSLLLKTSKPIVPYYQINLGDADIPFSGIIGADIFYPPEKYGGYITYITRYLIDNEALMNKDENDILSEYIPHLKKICSNFSESWILNKKLVKGRNVEPLHSVNYHSRIPDINTPISGLSLMTTAHIYPDPTILDTVVKQAQNIANGYRIK